jgi:hypothetical protein
MRSPRISIAEIMVIVAIAALDCLAIRVRSVLILYPLIFGGLPMQIALVIGLLILFRQRKRGDKPFPFLMGFEVVGWVGLLVYVAVCFQAPQSLDQHLSHTLGPVVSALGFQRFAADFILRCGIALTYLTMLQLIPALVAGWICLWWSKRSHTEPVLPQV